MPPWNDQASGDATTTDAKNRQSVTREYRIGKQVAKMCTSTWMEKIILGNSSLRQAPVRASRESHSPFSTGPVPSRAAIVRGEGH